MSLLPVLAVIVVVAIWLFTRNRTLFVLSVRDGRTLVVRGRIPGRLLADFRDVMSRARVHRATIRAYAGEDGGQLSTSGIDDRLEQQLRNVFRMYPLAQLRDQAKRPTLGQMVGVAWLASLFSRFR